ncbi:MAG: type II toxin-antitoxin system RelE/ParE family toxin [Deltaproteobacteria bacterium]|nr:type II toxin-antitoxin system RelE/ParE family toxin [Deltaproteobacteria bacterium]
MEAVARRLEIYMTTEGREPFSEWLEALKDLEGRAAIRARLERVEDGNFGAARPVGEGVNELKVSVGPGYRVYYALDGPLVVLLLCGGDKSSQRKDIKQAKTYWADYKVRG